MIEWVSVKVLVVTVIAASIVATVFMAVCGFSTTDDMPLPAETVDMLTSEMERIDAAWAVFDANTGAWVLQDDMRRELGRLELVDGGTL